jgi:hypothetical protein
MPRGKIDKEETDNMESGDFMQILSKKEDDR